MRGKNAEVSFFTKQVKAVIHCCDWNRHYNASGGCLFADKKQSKQTVNHGTSIGCSISGWLQN